MMTAGKVAVLHVAKKQLGLDEDTYRTILRNYGGSETGSARDLDVIGFENVMACFRNMGFRSDFSRRNYAAHRVPGMATAAQVALIRKLWAEWSDEAAEDEAAIGRWLDRHYGVSALRFVSREVAGKAITRLKAMVRRKTSAGTPA